MVNGVERPRLRGGERGRVGGWGCISAEAVYPLSFRDYCGYELFICDIENYRKGEEFVEKVWAFGSISGGRSTLGV